MQKSQELKIALVHDFLNQYGGAEKVLETFCEMFPKAPIFTLLYDPEKMRGKFSDKKIYTSFLQKFPKFLRKRPKWLLPFFPTAPEIFDLREYDLIISSSGAWSKGIVTRLDIKHIAYIHSPMRFVWDYNEKYLKEERKKAFGFLIRPFLSYLRLWDTLAADRPDYLIANSKYTKSRIKKYYRRDSEVIYPPIEINNGRIFKIEAESSKSPENYFLIVSRLSAYKKIDEAIKAFNELKLPLVIVGEGKEEERLKSIAKENIRFLGYLPDEMLSEIYAGARAFVFPGIDDFGMAPAEAMTYGVPVIAIKKGGITEVVEEGKSGEFMETSFARDIIFAVKKFLENEKNYDENYIKRSVEKFSKERFKREIKEFIEKIK
jgi:glycosyltransferase involved in cell wall biosynthesis